MRRQEHPSSSHDPPFRIAGLACRSSCPACTGNTGNIQHLYLYTGAAIDQRRYQLARSCFALAELLYERGSAVVRNAVENVFVCSFGILLHRHAPERQLLMGLVPLILYFLYVHQQCQPGCC